MGKQNIQQILTAFNDFAGEREWGQFHSIKNLSCALCVESSELLEIFQWAKQEQIDEWIKNDTVKKEKIADEIADVFLYLIKIASLAEVDIIEAAQNKIKKNAVKYPVEKSKGNSKKYTEFD